MSQPQLNSLYQALILDHYRNPRNKAELDGHTVEVHMANPVCGDEITLQLQLDDSQQEIVKATFEGQGCSISQAAVSMMTVLLQGRRIDDAVGIANRFTEMMHGDQDAASDKALGDLRALQGVSKFPVRIKCALLGFDALQEALKQAGLGDAH